jgi:hypothetical protein
LLNKIAEINLWEINSIYYSPFYLDKLGVDAAHYEMTLSSASIYVNFIVVDAMKPIYKKMINIQSRSENESGNGRLNIDF